MITVRVVPGTTDDALRAVRQGLRPDLGRLVRRLTIAAESEIARGTPIGATGATRRGYSVQFSGMAGSSPRGAVVNPISYFDFVDAGRRPGRMPPPAALLPGVATKWGIAPNDRQRVAYLVARAIGRRGTTGADMVVRGVDEVRRKADSELARVGLRMVARFEKT